MLDKATTNRFLTAFRRLYPRLGYEFDKRIEQLPQALLSYRRYMEDMHKKWKEQECCQHEYNKPEITLLGYGKQCYKCNYIRIVKNGTRS